MKKEKDIFDRLMELPVLRVFGPFYRKNKEVLLYLFFGGLTTVVSIGSYGYLVYTGMNVLQANVISWILAVLFAYVTNSVWVFDSKVPGWRERLCQIAGFYGGRAATLAMEEAVLLVFVELLHLNAIAVKAAAQVMVVIANYVISKLVVFRKR